MPGKSKKGGGLEVKPAYKMKYQGNHSAFPFSTLITKRGRQDFTEFGDPESKRIRLEDEYLDRDKEVTTKRADTMEEEVRLRKAIKGTTTGGS